MKLWYVVTPEYGEVVPVLDYGQGPLEYQADVVEVEADTKRDAIVIGVALMRKNPREYHYFRHCEGNPYVGVKAEPAPSPELVAHYESCGLCGDGELCDVGKALA